LSRRNRRLLGHPWDRLSDANLTCKRFEPPTPEHAVSRAAMR
jgi:hypothetical protein